MEQYRKGEAFVRSIADRRGPEALTRLWEGPETLPRDGEIDAARPLDPPRPRYGRRVTEALVTASGSRPRTRRRPDGHRAESRSSRPAIGRATSSASAPRRRAPVSSRCRVEGLADGPLEDVEVMLRGWLSSDAFDRLLARAPHLSLGPLGDLRCRAGAHAGGPRARRRRDERPRCLQPADRRIRPDDDPGRQPAAPAAPRAAARADVAAARGRRAARRDGRHRRVGSIGRAVGALATAFGCRVVAVRRSAGPGGRGRDVRRRGRSRRSAS